MALRPPERRILPTIDRRMELVDAELVAVLRELAIGRQSWPLLLHSQPGRGKTLAALALCDRAETACYHTIEGLCDATMRDEPVDLAQKWEAIEKRSLAVLDELGCRERVTDLHYASVKRFADARELYAGRVAVYVSNVDPKVIGTLYDGRIASRLLCGTWYELKGNDRRIQK